MKLSRLIVLIAVTVAALSHVSDGQQARPVAEQLALASVCPRGALVYVQARDLSALMKAWLASTVRDKFYKSPSFDSFSKSRIWLKMLDRKKDLESAIGVGIDEARLSELAGGASAISIYDIGKLEVVFVTEIPRERAVLTSLFKQAPQFQERTASGNAYYVHDVTTDGGRLNQQFCFAHANGKLIVTTTEGLMIRALGNAKSASADSLLADAVATAQQARGFASHEVTMWLDQARLNRNRHFNSYWLYRNANSDSPLADIESGLLDLRVTPQGMTEQRWFVMAGGAASPKSADAMTANQASGLLRFVTNDSQLAQVRPAGSMDELTSIVSDALLGKLPEDAPQRPEAPDRTRSNSEESETRTERYSRLDARFDMDADDEQAPDRKREGSSKTSSSSQAGLPSAPAALVAVLGKTSPVGYCELVRSKTEAGKPFVRFERAVVIEMKSEGAMDRQALDRAITDEMRARFVVAGVDPRLVWQDEAPVRYLSQSLLEQGAAYSISGKYIVLASSKEFARDIAQAATRTADAARIDEAVQFYALVRVADAKPVFDKLMSKLDGKTEAVPAAPKKKSEDEESDESEKEIKFFSDNLSSLIASTTIREMRVHRQMSGALMIERVVYSW